MKPKRKIHIPTPREIWDSLNSPKPTALSKDSFYIFQMSEVKKTLSKGYLKFLMDSGYSPNLNDASEIGIAKSILQINQAVRDSAQQAGLTIGNDGDYLVNINHANGKKIVEAIGYKLPTAGLMYKLFIPWLKSQAEQNNPEAKATLNEMTNTKAEWLEDLILNKNALMMGSKKIALTLPQKDGRFDRAEINEYGYPTAVKDAGEFYYWYPKGDKMAAIRDWGSELNLYLYWVPSNADDDLGVRAIFFPEEIKV